MPSAVTGALIGSAVTLFAVFLASYLSSRAEVDKKLLELHAKLLEDMLIAISRDSTDLPLDTRVKLHLPQLLLKWRTYWARRDTAHGSVQDDYFAEQLVRDIEDQMKRPLPGTLLHKYASAAALLAALMILEGYRIAGLAYPTLVEPYGIDSLYDIVSPLDFERSLGIWVRGLQLEELDN